MITQLIIGKEVPTETHYDLYEVWLQFASGDTECFMVEPSEILRVVNEWSAVIGWDGNEAESVIGQADFPWPDHGHEGGPSTFATLEAVTVYYYDTESRKRSVELK